MRNIIYILIYKRTLFTVIIAYLLQLNTFLKVFLCISSSILILFFARLSVICLFFDVECWQHVCNVGLNSSGTRDKNTDADTRLQISLS